MAKQPKIKVAEAGSEPALSHNPFAALANATAPQHTATTSHPTEAKADLRAPARRVVLRRETKRRAGRAVVIVSGLHTSSSLDDAAIDELARDLKRQLACGGSVEASARDGEPEIVLQGDQPARVAELLRARGFQVSGVTS